MTHTDMNNTVNPLSTMYDNLPQNSIQLVLNSAGYMVIGAVTQQNDTFMHLTHRVQEKLNAILWKVLKYPT
jgi:hypothetical protein